MIKDTYGILDSNGCHVDVSSTLHGAKCYATRHGYNTVTIRFKGGYISQILESKVSGKWEKVTIIN